MVQNADPTSLSVEPARASDYAAIAELTVRVYVDGGLASEVVWLEGYSG